MVKRIFLFLCVGAILAGMLAGCGGTAATNGVVSVYNWVNIWIPICSMNLQNRPASE